MLIFTKFKNSLFQGPTLGNCFRSFKRIARKSFLHRVPGVHKQDGIGVQINTLQTQGIEITLIHMLFQRHDSETALNQRSFYPLCLQGICLETYLENIRNELQLK